MDLQRTLLIGAIALLLFMLLTEWVAFKDEKTAAVAQETSRLISNTGDIPDAVPAPAPAEIYTESAEEDLPAPPDQAPAVAQVPTIEPVDSSRIVQIYSDVLQLAIDLKGGDIIELSLRKHLARLDEPNQPFVLLEDNEALIYVAQSGLIGTDGIDNNGRANYTASASRFTMTEGEDTLVVDLHWQDDSNVKVTKRLTLHRGEYLIDVDYIVENNSSER